VFAADGDVRSLDAGAGRWPDQTPGAAGHVACLTRDGTITLLRGTDLEPLSTCRLNVRPGYTQPAHLLMAVGFPLAVPGSLPVDNEADELDAELSGALGESGDCLLAVDEQG